MVSLYACSGNGLQIILLLVVGSVVQVFPLVLHHRQSANDAFINNNSLAVASPRARETCRRLLNEETHFTIEVSVGTPPQKFELVADTGSDAVIVQSCVCQKISIECKSSEDCYKGTNFSSTFVPPEPDSRLRVLSFGSGDIVVAAATDIVRLGQESATMNKSLMLMVDRQLRMAQNFEGILGLGVPSEVEVEAPKALSGGVDPNGGNVPRKIKDKSSGNFSDPVPRFLEEAGINRFSICFNDNMEAGVMRLEPPKAPKMLKQVGFFHWAVELQGFSVGSASASRVGFCLDSAAEVGRDLACAAVPDSGTTLMMGPKKEIDLLFADICAKWTRCDPHLNHPRPEKAFVETLMQCSTWMTDKGLEEVPSLFIHVAGADGETQIIELSSWAYITVRLWEGKEICEPQFGAYDIFTMQYGSMWIFGGPLFYEFQVVFEHKPPSIGFEKASCGSCDDFGSSNITLGLERRTPRHMQKPPRMPTMSYSGSHALSKAERNGVARMLM